MLKKFFVEQNHDDDDQYDSEDDEPRKLSVDELRAIKYCSAHMDFEKKWMENLFDSVRMTQPFLKLIDKQKDNIKLDCIYSFTDA